MELENNMEINKFSNKLFEAQQNFLQTTIGKTINSAIDIGLKAVLPDIIEDQIIDIKNAILENGFSEGIKEVINSSINTGKSLMGIVTGNFENVSQIQMAVKKGGILDKISELLDYGINIANNKKLIDKSISNLLKNGKNTIINSISNNIEETLTKQIKAIEKLDKYCENWNIAYGVQDIKEMENAYKNIKNNLNKVIPLESIIKKARTIENIQNLIKNGANKKEINNLELELAKKI